MRVSGPQTRKDGRDFVSRESLEHLTCPARSYSDLRTTEGTERHLRVLRYLDGSARTPSFSTVFQFLAVPRVPSFFSMSAVVSLERPMPSGYTM